MISWTPTPIHCGVQENSGTSAQEHSGEMHGKSKKDKENKKRLILLGVDEKKRIPQAPKTDDLQRCAEPVKGASEISRMTPDPLSVARGRPRMALDQPSWQASQAGGDLPEHSSGEPSTGVAAAESGVSSAVRIHGNVLELAGRVQNYPTRVLLDSGLTGNFISTQLW